MLCSVLFRLSKLKRMLNVCLVKYVGYVFSHPPSPLVLSLSVMSSSLWDTKRITLMPLGHIVQMQAGFMKIFYSLTLFSLALCLRTVSFKFYYCQRHWMQHASSIFIYVIFQSFQHWLFKVCEKIKLCGNFSMMLNAFSHMDKQNKQQYYRTYLTSLSCLPYVAPPLNNAQRTQSYLFHKISACILFIFLRLTHFYVFLIMFSTLYQVMETGLRTYHTHTSLASTGQAYPS